MEEDDAEVHWLTSLDFPMIKSIDIDQDLESTAYIPMIDGTLIKIDMEGHFEVLHLPKFDRKLNTTSRTRICPHLFTSTAWLQARANRRLSKSI